MESLFIDEALSYDVVGMKNERMVKYIEFVADRLFFVLLLLRHLHAPAPPGSLEECRLPLEWALLRPIWSCMCPNSSVLFHRGEVHSKWKFDLEVFCSS